jgi:hypothetical protein
MISLLEKFSLSVRLAFGDRALRELASILLALGAIGAAGVALSRSPDLAAPGVTGSVGLADLRMLVFPFALFSGASVLTAAATQDRARALAIGALAAVAAMLELARHPAMPGLGVALWASAAFGIVAGPGVTTLWESLAARRPRPAPGPAPTPSAAAAEAASWFVRLHREEPDVFDWNGFERWIAASRAHRAAYDRLETLWYEMDRPGDPPLDFGQATAMRPRARILGEKALVAVFGDDRRVALVRLSTVMLFWVIAVLSLRI